MSMVRQESEMLEVEEWAAVVMRWESVVERMVAAANVALVTREVSMVEAREEGE